MSKLNVEDDIIPLSAMSDASSDKTATSSKNMIRAEVAVGIAEFVGTFMFFLMAFIGAQIAIDSQPLNPVKGATTPELLKLLYISLSFGIALMINVAIWADVSGGMYNPAVTLGLLIVRAIKWQRAIVAVVAQCLASICAAAIADALLPGPLLVVNGLNPKMSVGRGLFMEMFLTAQLVLIVVMHPGGSSKPAYVGMTLFIGHIVGVFWSGGSLNPARTLGPAVVIGFTGIDWIYLIGPAMGACLAAGVHYLLKLVQGM